MANSGKRDSKTPAAFPARAALLEGDFKRAHTLALAVKDNPEAGEAEKKDALALLDATKVDSVPIFTGLGVFCILMVLFGLVVVRARAGF